MEQTVGEITRVRPDKTTLFGRCRLATITVLAVALGVAALLATPASPAVANDTAVGGIGGVIYPLENTDIQMEAETVQAICYRSFAEYRIDFQFVNDGEAQTVMLGFPFAVTIRGMMASPPVAFQAWQDDQPLSVTLGRGVAWEDFTTGDPPLGYYVHKATFPHGETMVRVSYLAKPTVSAGGRSEPPPELAGLDIGGWAASYGYWVHTGAGWKGTIGKTVIRFNLADDFNGWGIEEQLGDWETTMPDSYTKVDARTYQWVYEDYEPTEDDDVRLAFTRPNYVWLHSTEGLPRSFGAVPLMNGRPSHSHDEAAFPASWEAVDSNIDTFWEMSPGEEGSSMKVDIAVNQNLRELRILPGRHDTLSSFSEYGRPKTIRVTLSDGTSAVINLKDEAALQRFAIAGKAEWVKFEVLDSYAGTKSSKTYISEIDFGTAPAPELRLFAELMAEKALPATPTTAPMETSSTSPPTGATDSPGTSLPAGSASPTTVSEAGSAPTTGLTTTIAAASEDGVAADRLLWAAWLGLAVAVLGLGALACLMVRLRRGGRPL